MEISGHFLARTYGLVILFLIPITIGFFRKSYITTALLGIIFFLAFAEGALQLLGFNPSYNRLLRDVIILVGFFSVYSPKMGMMSQAEKNIIGILIFFIIVSYLFGESSLFQLALFVRRVGFNFLLMYYVANIKFSEDSFKKLFHFIVGLFIVQIPISFIKLFFFGIGEDYIGSVSTVAGSITTSLTLIAVSYLLTRIFYKGKVKYIIFFFLFLFFAVTGAKRAVFIFVPLLILVALFYMKSIRFKQLLLIVLMIPVSLIFILKISPSLNPEHKVWGSFSPAYVINYFNQRAAVAENSNVTNSRILVFNYFFNNFINKPKDVILGHGPGIVFPNGKNDIKKYGSGEQYLLNKFGLGYGSRLGVLWLFFQMGLFFVVFYLMFHYIIYKKIKNKVDGHNLLFIRLLFSVYLMDMFLYSSSFISPSAITITFYSVLGFYLNNNFRSACTYLSDTIII